MFEKKKFISHSGKELTWKIECDHLTDNDIDVIAEMIGYSILFGSVEGVPSGGLRLAAALEKYCDKNSNRLLIVDDVLTTGQSMEEHRNGRDACGVVIFSRTSMVPSWIYPIWQLHPYFTD